MVATRRARKSAQVWAEIVKEFESSKLNESEFCESLDLSPVTFRKWRYKRSIKTDKSLRTTTGGFTPVAINQTDPPRPASGVRIDLGGEVRIDCDSLSIPAIAQLALAVRYGR